MTNDDLRAKQDDTSRLEPQEKWETREVTIYVPECIKVKVIVVPISEHETTFDPEKPDANGGLPRNMMHVMYGNPAGSKVTPNPPRPSAQWDQSKALTVELTGR